MALNLDTRQRAMLQEMGITVWMPKPAAAAALAPAAAAVPSAAVAVAAVAAPVQAPAPQAAPTSTPAAPMALAPAAPPAAPVTSATLPTAIAEAAAAWRMAAPVQAYPHATGGAANDAWLVIWECATPAAPFEGDSGKLLNNMLRALRLHHSAYVWIAGMQRPGYEALPVTGLPHTPIDWQSMEKGLPSAIQQTQPARILLLGMHAARAVLASQEALGRLRAQVHQVHHIPTVVTYDPAYLLRSPHAKPAAWADLCRAHALRPPSAL